MRTIAAIYKPNKSERKPKPCKGCGMYRRHFVLNKFSLAGDYCNSCQLQIDNGVDIGMMSIRRKTASLNPEKGPHNPTCNICGVAVTYIVKKTGQHAKMCYDCRVKFQKRAENWRKLHPLKEIV